MKRLNEEDLGVTTAQATPIGVGVDEDPLQPAFDAVHATRLQRQRVNRLRWGLGLKPKDALPAIELIALFGSEIVKNAAERRLIERKAARRNAALLAVAMRMLALHRADQQMAKLKIDLFGKSVRRPECQCGPCLQAREAVAAELGCKPDEVMARIDVDGRLVAAVVSVRLPLAEDAA